MTRRRAMTRTITHKDRQGQARTMLGKARPGQDRHDRKKATARKGQPQNGQGQALTIQRHDKGQVRARQDMLRYDMQGQ